MDLKILKKKAADAIDREKDSIFKLSHYINSNPETAFKEFLASSALTDFLSERGFSIKKEAGGLETAFIADFGTGGAAGDERVPTAIIAEYDALPGVGHGCGHNLIAAAAAAAGLGTAAALGTAESRGAVRVIGCPAEEVLTTKAGKNRLIEAGVFKAVDSALIFHPWTETGVARKDLGCRSFHIEFEGQAAHAAADPWNGINAVDASVIFYNSVSVLRQQLPNGLKLHCIIPEAGSVLNVIPDKAVVEVMIRSTELDDLQKYEKRVRACAEAAALASGCSFSLRMMAAVKPIRFNRDIFDLTAANMKEMGEELEIMDLWEASSDFGDVSHEVPAQSLLYRTHEQVQCWHSKDVAEQAAGDKSNEAMLRAAKILSATAIDLIFNPLREQ